MKKHLAVIVLAVCVALIGCEGHKKFDWQKLDPSSVEYDMALCPVGAPCE